MNLKKFANRLKVVLLIMAALFSVHFVLYNPFFGVTGLNINGNLRVTSEEVTALSGIVNGMNIFSIDTAASSQSIETNPLIKQALIERHWNRTVSIKITERQTWAVIPYGDSFLCLDDTGICFDKTGDLPGGDYPLITLDNLPEPINLGQALNSSATEMIRQIWVALPALERDKISEFHWIDQSNSLNIYTVRGTEVRFGDMERFDEKLKSLGQVMEIEDDIEAKGIDVLEYVDIRFKGEPILKTKG